VVYASSSSALATGSALTFDGLNFAAGRVLSGRYTSDANNWGIQNYSATSAFGSGIQLVYGGVGAAAIWVPAASSLAFGADVGAGTTEQMRLTSTGLGIGTSSPTVPLTVGDSTAPTGLTPISVMISTNTSTGQVLNVRKSCDTALGSSISLMKSRGTAASPVVVNTGDTAGGVIYSAFAGTNYRQIASINGTVEAYVSDTNISGYLVFNTNSASTGTAERMRLDSAGNLGLGVTPSAWTSTHKAYQLQGGGSVYNNGADGYLNLANNFYYDGTDWRRVTAAPVSTYLQSSSGHLWGYTGTGSANSVCGFPSVQMSLNTSGGLKTLNTIGVGDATPSGSGAGITFPATQSASSDANTLDDYEEGTWTPTDNSGAGLTFTSVYASYIKIGRAVTINVELTFPSTANASAVAISLPFSSDSSTRGGGAIFSNRSSAGTNIYFPGGANFVLYDDAGGSLTNANLTTKYLIFSLTYFTA
jgi:hypothetical protein